MHYDRRRFSRVDSSLLALTSPLSEARCSDLAGHVVGLLLALLLGLLASACAWAWGCGSANSSVG